MIAKYLGITLKIYNSIGKELELKEGEDYDIIIKKNFKNAFYDLVIFGTIDGTTYEFTTRYYDINILTKTWKSESYEIVINEPEEEDQTTLDIINATYIGADRNIGDVDLVNNTKYKIRVMCKYPGIIFRVYSDDDFADIMYFSTKEITRKWSGESEFEYLIEQIEKEKSIKQHKLARESRLEILEKAMKDKSSDKEQHVYAKAQIDFPYVGGFKNDNIISDSVLVNPTWLKVEVYDLIKKQLKSYDEDEWESIACCESDIEFSNYVRGLFDLADSIIKKDDKSIEEADRSDNN